MRKGGKVFSELKAMSGNNIVIKAKENNLRMVTELDNWFREVEPEELEEKELYIVRIKNKRLEITKIVELD